MAFPKKLVQFFNRASKIDPFLKKLPHDFINNTIEVNNILTKAINGKPLIDNDYFVRLFPEIVNNLIDLKLEHAGHDKNVINHDKVSRDEIVLIKKWASKIADKVFFIPNLFAYHPKQLPPYDLIYSMIKPHFNFPKDPRFYSASAMYNLFKYIADKNSSICKEYGIETLSYKEQLISAMPTTSGLFIDEIHPTAKGATMASKYFARKFAPLIEEKLKIKIDKTAFSDSLENSDKGTN